MKKILVLILVIFLFTPANVVFAEYATSTVVTHRDTINVADTAFPSSITGSFDIDGYEQVVVETNVIATGTEITSPTWRVTLALYSGSTSDWATESSVDVSSGGNVNIFTTYGYSNGYILVDEPSTRSIINVYIKPIKVLREQKYRHDHWYDINQ